MAEPIECAQCLASLRKSAPHSEVLFSMPGKIKILPEPIAQAIAAGEVVERPASVVKELVENAIDAGSSEVIVELEAGGLQLIRVSDNGEGIHSEDVPLALQRYATSKIQKTEDLYAIHTLGFRGEALPSIASVSQMMIKTRRADSISGTKAICEGGEIKSISEVGCPVGTEVEVRNIFFNIPVKRKFLRSIRSELRHALHLFLRLSLSYPAISFRFLHDGRMLYELLKTDSSLVRVEAILGREIVGHLRAIAFEDGKVSISGFGSLPSLSKGTAEGNYLYVNHRWIKDRAINRAILEAYRHLLPAGRYPVTVLCITLPFSAIDVNVHPTKAEVKFKDPENIFQAILTALRMVLEEGRGQIERPSAQGVGEESRIPEGMQPSFPFQKPGLAYAVGNGERDGKGIPMVRENSAHQRTSDQEISFQIIGQVRGTYILYETEGNLIFVDQHAAHERLLFNRYKHQYETESIPSKRFLHPIPMELSIEESFLLTSHLEAFESMGFEMDRIGEGLYAIRSIPTLVDQHDPKEIVREILDELSFLKGEGKGTEAIHAILVTLACHTAIRGNFTLRREEMEELAGNLFSLHSSATCPHGRPIFFIIPIEELKKQFKRR